MKTEFTWPEGKRGAVSFTMDDARFSQLDRGMPILDEWGMKGTFYVSLPALEARAEEWRRVRLNGHEIGNHTATHPCSGNFGFSRRNPLEEFSLEKMEKEITGANAEIEKLVGARATTFAFPCGQKFVGRGESVSSYVPLVAKHFLAGRGFRDECANDPLYCDLAQLFGADVDGMTPETLVNWLKETVKAGRWLVLGGHEVGESGKSQTVLTETLEALCRFAKDPANGMWMGTIAEVATYVKASR